MSDDFEKTKMVGLRDGGHICGSHSRVITLCELGISPIWCPKPAKYTFTEKCEKCYLFQSTDGSHVDYSKLNKK
jgi:hypothetical protein